MNILIDGLIKRFSLDCNHHKCLAHRLRFNTKSQSTRRSHEAVSGEAAFGPIHYLYFGRAAPIRPFLRDFLRVLCGFVLNLNRTAMVAGQKPGKHQIKCCQNFVALCSCSPGRSLCSTITFGLRRAYAVSGFRKMSNCFIKIGAGVRSKGHVHDILCSTPQWRLCSRQANAVLLPRGGLPASCPPERMICSTPAHWPVPEGWHQRRGWWNVSAREQGANDVQ